MKKILIFFLAVSTLFGSRIITDQLGREVSLPDKINRVVVLQHQSLNILVQLDASDKIVGVLKSWEKNLGSKYAKFMPSLKTLPTPGDLKTINFEGVLALKPDVVIVTNYLDKDILNKMQNLGIPVVAMSFYKGAKNKINPKFKSYKDTVEAYDEGLYEGINLLAKIVNKEQNAKELIEFIKNSQKTLKEKISQIDTKNRVKLYVANPDFHTYGAGKYVNVMFGRAGGINVAFDKFNGYKQISPEIFNELNPEIIFVQNRYPKVVENLKENSQIKNVNAIKNDKIFLMPQYAKAWGYATPEAMGIGEFWVAKTLYPNEFKDFDLDKLVQDYYQKFYRTNYEK